MAEPFVVRFPKEKRAGIPGRIAAHEAKIGRAKRDLAHVDATLRLFADPELRRARRMLGRGVFRKGEIADVCVRPLAADGELTTRAPGGSCSSAASTPWTRR